jgi:hypothetical protein
MKHGFRIAAPITALLFPTEDASAGPGDIKGTLTVAYATLFDETLNPLFGPAPPKVYYDVMYEYLLYNEPQTWKLEPGSPSAGPCPRTASAGSSSCARA